MDRHDLIAALKNLALELGETPTRVQFFKMVARSENATMLSGGYTALVHAAGLEPRKMAKKIDNKIFEKNIEAHLEKYQPKERKQLEPYPSIASLSDIHWPFSCQRVIDKFIAYVGEHKPEHVIIDGDAWDMYSHAKFPRSHNSFTPREEQALARDANEKFWQEIKRVHQKSKCYQLLGNHDVRPLKRVLEQYPAAEDWVTQALNSLFTFDGVKTIYDPREELIIGNVVIHHGYRSGLGAHRDYTLQNIIVGHTHHGGTVFRQVRGELIFELNCGYAGDPEAKGLSYTAQKITTQTHGFGVVDKYGPRFIPA